MKIKTFKLQIILAMIFIFSAYIASSNAVAFPKSDKKKSSKGDVTKQVSDLEKKVTSLTSKLNKIVRIVNSLSKRVTELEKTVPTSRAAEFKSYTESMGNSITKLDSVTKFLSSDVLDLQRQIDAAGKRDRYADSINFEVLSQLVILENRIMSLGTSLNEYRSISQGSSYTKSTTSNDSYRERYLQALTFHQNNQNEESIELFNQLIAEDKNHELSDNAQYWIGECYYSLKQYQRAIIEFKKVFSFANTNKSDDAQFKLGLCHAALGDRKKAIDEFQRLIDY
ncbi:MAG: hypothetical protein DRP89_05460, partial [Candidatus Neomarinimicrobiota bacterium]